MHPDARHPQAWRRMGARFVQYYITDNESATGFMSTPYRELLKQQYLHDLFVRFIDILSPFFRERTREFFTRQGRATMTELIAEVADNLEHDPSFIKEVALELPTEGEQRAQAHFESYTVNAIHASGRGVPNPTCLLLAIDVLFQLQHVVLGIPMCSLVLCGISK